jgi:transposase
MIDTSTVRVNQHAAGAKKGLGTRHMGRSLGGLTTKIHAVVDRNGLPVRLALTQGQDHDTTLVVGLLANLKPHSLVSADRAYDRAYDADAIRTLVNEQEAFANIPPSATAWTRFASVLSFTELGTRSNASSTS